MESVVIIILVIVITVVGRVRKAQRKGGVSFKLPTPKSWQLPAPGPGNVIQPIQGNQPVRMPPPSYGPQVAPGYAPQQPATWVPTPVAPHLPGQVRQPPPQQRLPHHRPQPHQLPAQQGDLDNRVRELMASNQEVAAVRLLSEEADLGIIKAQEYARSLVSPTGRQPAAPPASPAVQDRYDGSAAFGTSLFERDDENAWASGWVDSPEPDDRTDITELWNTVRNAATPDQSRG